VEEKPRKKDAKFMTHAKWDLRGLRVEKKKETKRDKSSGGRGNLKDKIVRLRHTCRKS